MMADPELGLLPIMVKILIEDKGEARMKLCSALSNLARAPENKVLMAATELGLIPALVTIIKEDKGQARMKACSTISSLVVAPENKGPMVAANVGLLPALVMVIVEDKGEARAKVLIFNKLLLFIKRMNGLDELHDTFYSKNIPKHLNHSYLLL